MTEPGSPVQMPPQRPFAAEPTTPPGGCGKPLLIGCGLLAILLGIGAVVFVVKAKSLLAFALDKLQAEVVANLPEDVTPAERERLDTAFSATLGRIRKGEIDPEALQRLQARLVEATNSASQDKLTRAEVQELTLALEGFAGIEPAAPPEGGEPPGEGGEPAGPPEAAPADPMAA
ncbi:MAG: hypothetical protein KDB94_05900 [Acidobacteria bacterium]|nr:hypothetical protein [Acidobacteriota bacterium]MCB9378805.1 hypothetical protein [Holophagales bacterium]